jgi:inorganic triphosphatase YgiF
MMTIEVKFRIPDPGTFWLLQTIDRLGPYSLSEPQFEDIDDVFLDTRRRKLQTADYCCRQRNLAKGFLISLVELESKSRRTQQAKKWEVSLKRNTNDPSDWPKSQVRKRVLKIIADKKLHPIFTLHQTRITRLISDADQVIAEATLDDVSLIVKGENQQFKTLKITTVVSDDDLLEAISASLQEKWQLETEPRTKFEQVLALENY